MVDSTEKRLGDVAEIMAGLTGFSDKGKYRYNVVQPNSFTDTGLMNEADVQRRGDELADKQLLSVGDILVKRLNPSFVHVVTLESVGMVASQNILVVRPGAEIDPDYLGYLLEQKEILGQVEHVTGSAAAIKAVSVKKLAGITIPVISLAEQRKVGAIWKLSRKRKQLLNEYMPENDRLVSLLASQIINGGGNRR
ncbi:MAG: restriction endonuclease subunit S [Eubacteriales bacterium]|nr:restriction endonuclease subunit S [Eubacteriales bacterium]